MTDLWPRIEPLLLDVERPARYIDREWGAFWKPEASFRVAFAYPDTYEVGQANAAIALLAQILRNEEGIDVQRAYLPWIDLASKLRERDIPLFALESCAPVREFDLVGITLPHELAATNILEFLDLSKIPLRSKDRQACDPIVIGGGPCCYDPEPFAPFFDAILIGEGEEAVLEIARSVKAGIEAGTPREQIVAGLASISGVYVPCLYEACFDAGGQYAGMVSKDDRASAVVTKRVVKDFSSAEHADVPIVPYVDVIHDRPAIEVLRGCSRGCRFCQAGMVYRPVRERSADEVVKATIDALACTGYEEVSLTSLSTTDHSQIEQILRRLGRRLVGTGVRVSLPSQRVDAFGVEMARLVAGTKKGGLTLAPEAGTQRLRDAINKNVTEEDILTAVESAFSVGWRRIKLYFMLGLPTETDDDVCGIARLTKLVHQKAREVVPPDQRGSVKVSVSVSTFIPKASTPFQWDAQISQEEIVRKQQMLRDELDIRGIDLHYHESAESLIEAIVAVGDRSVADLIEQAWRNGAKFDAWSEQFSLAHWQQAAQSLGVDLKALAQTPRSEGDILPWSHISAGVSEDYLRRERKRAFAGDTTPDCSFSGCTGCDVCQDLGVDIVLGGASR